MTLVQATLEPIKKLLVEKKQELVSRKKRLTDEDPFGDPERLMNNAAIDADAQEQFGHENSSAMLEEVDRSLGDIDRALARIETGAYGKCLSCGNAIDEGRLKIEPTAEYCVDCQRKQSVS